MVSTLTKEVKLQLQRREHEEKVDPDKLNPSWDFPSSITETTEMRGIHVQGPTVRVQHAAERLLTGGRRSLTGAGVPGITSCWMWLIRPYSALRAGGRRGRASV